MHNRRTRGRRDPTGIAYGLLVVLLVVTIQFGYTTYESVQFCAFLIVFSLLLPGLIGNIRTVVLPVLLSGYALYITAAVYINSANASHNLLWSSREFVCFLCIIATRYTSLDRVPRLPGFVFWVLIVAIGALTFGQWAYLHGIISRNTLIANKFFAVNAGTVAEDKSDLAIAGGWESIIRPSAFYTEPSYLGFICLCLYVSVHRPNAIRSNFIAFALLLLLCLIAKTASGIIILCVIFFCVNAKAFVFNRRFYPVFAIVCGVAVYASLPFISRLVESTDPVSEASGYTRVVFPIKCVGAVFLHAPLGVPLAELPDFCQAHLPEDAASETARFDNGLLNLFIFHGVFAFVILICLIGMMRNWALALFVIFCAFNNGSLFGYDKAVLISISILAYLQNNRKGAVNWNCKRISISAEHRTMQHSL
jgi:hypothetical protein